MSALKIRYILLPVMIVFTCCFGNIKAQDTIKVYFLYGSKPKKEFVTSEKKWFGGRLGGHVGIGFEEEKIINFVPRGKFHLFPDSENKRSKFVIFSSTQFWSIFGSNPETVKKSIVIIPITTQQKQILDSIVKNYTSVTPYDYAFFGMRCGAATYDMLAQLGIVKKHSHRKTIRKVFYPKKLRKRLFRKASKNNWEIIREKGSARRIWEKD